MTGFEKLSGKEANSPVLLRREHFAPLHPYMVSYEYTQSLINEYLNCYRLRFNEHLCTSLFVDMCFDFSWVDTWEVDSFVHSSLCKQWPNYFSEGCSWTAYDGFYGAMHLSTLAIVSLFSFSHSGRFNWILILGWSIFFFLISDHSCFFFFFLLEVLTRGQPIACDIET